MRRLAYAPLTALLLLGCNDEGENEVVWTVAPRHFRVGRLFAVPKAGGDRREPWSAESMTELAIRGDTVYVALPDADWSRLGALALQTSAHTILGCAPGQASGVQVNASSVFLVTDKEVRSYSPPYE